MEATCTSSAPQVTLTTAVVGGNSIEFTAVTDATHPAERSSIRFLNASTNSATARLKLGTANGRRVLDYIEATVTGQSAPTVTALALAGLDLRKHESSLVKLSNLRVSDPAYDAHAFEVVDRGNGAGSALVDDYFYAVSPATDDVFTSITGVLFCDTTRCAVAPRRAGDVAP